MTWPDGRRYEGQFIDNELNGKGIMTWSDGQRYEMMHSKIISNYLDSVDLVKKIRAIL